MKFFLKRFLLSAATLIIFSCKKETAIFQSANQAALPSFSAIDPDEVLSKADSELPNAASVSAEISKYYQTVWEGGNLSGGLLVAKGNDIIFEKYRGFAQPGQTQPIDKDTPMHVASVSKTMTAMAILKLVEAGKIGLQDPLTKYFPEFPYPKVTVFTLLSQRSGLPKYEYFIEKIKPQPAELNKQFLTNEDILTMLIKYKPELSKETDTGFMYCNTNFALLGLLLQTITQTPFPEAMQQILFKPLKMRHTFIFAVKDTATVAKSFYTDGTKAFPLDRLDLIFGDKNVYTTPRDLLNFSRALFSDKFLKPELMSQVFAPHSNEKPGINNYGLGFRMKIFDNGEKLTYHNGWWHGSNAVFAHLLKSKVTIVAIGNKFSRKVYSALALSSLFENFPQEHEKLMSDMGLPLPDGASEEMPGE